MPTDKPRTNLSAPVLPFEYPWHSTDVIWPCHECMPWHLELFEHAAENDDLWVREWHAVDCPIWATLAEDNPPS